MWKYIFLIQSILFVIASAADNSIPEYIRPCRRSDPDLLGCVKLAIMHVRPYLSKGIPEIELPSIEPFIMDQLALQLTDGPQGYKITLKNIEVLGASDFDVQSLAFSDGDKPFYGTVTMKRLKIESKYTSSGVLLIIPASGGGEFHAVFDDIIANVTGKVSTKTKGNGTYIHIDALKLSLGIRNPQMSISRAFNNNLVLTQATNLFLRENGAEVLRAMQPQLQKKLAQEFAKIGNQLLKHVPIEQFYLD